MSERQTHDAAFLASFHDEVDRELKAMRADLRKRTLLAISEVHSGTVVEAEAIRNAIFITLAAWLEKRADESDEELSYRELANLSATFEKAARDE